MSESGGTALSRNQLLIGRQRELDKLVSLFAQTKRGQAQLVLVRGEAGIGKTRLLDSFAQALTEENAVVLRGGASRAEGMPPYLPFLEALSPYIRAASPETLLNQSGEYAAILATILPEFLMRLGDMPPAYPLPPEQSRIRLFEALAIFLKAISLPYGLGLLLDDLHWADPASLDLLVYIARNQKDAPLLIVGAYRDSPSDRSPVLDKTIAELARLRVLNVVTLGPLTRDEIRQLVRRTLDAPPDQAVVDLIFGQSEGNAFFAEELIRGWVESGELVRKELHWAMARRLAPSTPPDLLNIIRERLGNLSPTTLEYLGAAAVIGREFDPKLLANVLGRESEQVENALKEALDARVINPTTPEADAFAFTHDLIRQCLYDQVSPVRRRRWHGLIGRLLKAESIETGAEMVAELAFHFCRSGDRQQGAEYAARAAELALRHYAADEALRLYRLALKLIGPGDPRRSEWLVRLGEAAILAGQEDQAIDALEDAHRKFVDQRSFDQAAAAAHALGRAYWRLEKLPEARKALETAIRVSPDKKSETTAKVLIDLASLLGMNLHLYPEGLRLAAQALEAAEAIKDSRLLAAAYRANGNLLVRSNRLAAGITMIERALDLAKEADDPGEAAECSALLFMASGWNTNMQRAAAILPEWYEFSRRTRDPFQLRHIYSAHALSSWGFGNLSEAESLLDQAAAAVAHLDSPEPVAFVRMTRGLLALVRGEYGDAERSFSAGVDILRPVGPGALVWYLGLVGIAQAAQGRIADARATTLEIQSILETIIPDSLAAGTPLAHLFMIFLRLDDRQRLEEYYSRLAVFRGEYHDALVDRLLGEFETRKGDHAAAAQSLDAAESVARRERILFELAMTLEAQADLSLKRSGPGSSDDARLRLGEALSLYRKFGNATESKRLLSRLRQLPPQPGPRQIQAPARLSSREVQVLKLVVAGKSNREIAQALSLSVKTVSNHLTGIFNKIGVDNRAAAAAFAIRNGLA